MPKLNRITRALLALSLLAGLAACSDDDNTVSTGDGDGSTSTPAAAFGGAGCTAADLSTSTDLAAKPEVEVPDCAPPTTLEQADLVAGSGDAAAAGDTVSMQYVGVAWSTGTQFDASWDRGSEFTFALGSGQVIAGWDQGIVGMKQGGRRTLVIPSDLGYGDQGAGSDIKPGETLVFVVDLVSVTKPVPCDAASFSVSTDLTAKPTIEAPKCTSAAELATVDVVAGTGAEAAKGNKVTVKYVGITTTDGRQFDASWDRGDAFSFTLGAGEVIAGWDQGVAGMTVGGRRLLLIPSDLAYGPSGSPPAIGANATLVFVVDLVSVES